MRYALPTILIALFALILATALGDCALTLFARANDAMVQVAR